MNSHSDVDKILEKLYHKYTHIIVGDYIKVSSSKDTLSKSDKSYTTEELIKLIDKKKQDEFYENRKFVYGELTMSGVNSLYQEIKNSSTQISTFVDVGSGSGKICLHLSLISHFENLIGIEISLERHLFSLNLMESLGPEFDNVTFINDDVTQIEFEKPVVVFTNDVCFPMYLTEHIWEKLPKGSHFISHKLLDFPHKKIKLGVSWKTDTYFNYYIKN